MSEEERRRREDLSVALQRHGLMLADDSHWWLQYEMAPYTLPELGYPIVVQSLLKSVKQAVGRSRISTSTGCSISLGVRFRRSTR